MKPAQLKKLAMSQCPQRHRHDSMGLESEELCQWCEPIAAMLVVAISEATKEKDAEIAAERKEWAQQVERARVAEADRDRLQRELAGRKEIDMNASMNCPICGQGGGSGHCHTPQEIDEWIKAQALRFGRIIHTDDELQHGLTHRKSLFDLELRKMQQHLDVNRQRREEAETEALDAIRDRDALREALQRILTAEDGCGHEACNIGGGLCAACCVKRHDAILAARSILRGQSGGETPTATIRNDALEEAAKILEGGSFFHDDAPDARFAKHAADAIRRAKSPAATPKEKPMSPRRRLVYRFMELPHCNQLEIASRLGVDYDGMIEHDMQVAVLKCASEGGLLEQLWVWLNEFDGTEEKSPFAASTGGEKASDDDSSVCPRCEGTGRYKNFGNAERDCAVCSGSGKIHPEPAEPAAPLPDPNRGKVVIDASRKANGPLSAHEWEWLKQGAEKGIDFFVNEVAACNAVYDAVATSENKELRDALSAAIRERDEARAEVERLKGEWHVMARACGNWREWPGKSAMVDDHEHPDWKIAARAIVERDHITTRLEQAEGLIRDTLPRFTELKNYRERVEGTAWTSDIQRRLAAFLTLEPAKETQP